jgi:Predicted membrane-associated Zn-dependent proteases 1
VLNLLPIPVLDGGQIVLNIAESVKGSAFSAQTRERILKGGLLVIALLFVTVMFNDIARNMESILHIVGRLFGRSA